MRRDLTALLALVGLASLVATRPAAGQPGPDPTSAHYLFSIGAQAAAGRFREPAGAAFAPDGTLYVADSGNHRIQHLGPDGRFLAAWGGLGGGEGELHQPKGVAVGEDGSVWVADTGNHRVQHFAPDGRFLTAWDGAGGAREGIRSPEAIALAPGGQVLVADTGHNRILRFEPDGRLVDIWDRGMGGASLLTPLALAVATDGSVFVVEHGRRQVLVFAPDGRVTASWPAGPAQDEPTRLGPSAIAVAPDGSLLLANSSNQTLRRHAPDGRLLGSVGASSPAGLGRPRGLAVGADGSLVVVDAEGGRLLRFDGADGFQWIWGAGLGRAPEPGDGDVSRFEGPAALALSPLDGSVYVADPGSQRLLRYSAQGDFLGMWGAPGTGPAQLDGPQGIAVAPDGTVLVADMRNGRILRFDAGGRHLATWALPPGNDEEAGMAPAGIAVAPDGTVFATDYPNHRIVRFDAAGQALGAWGQFGRRPGELNLPLGIAIAPDGTVLVADMLNDRIQRFRPDGGFLATWGAPGSVPGRLDFPTGVAADPDGRVYVADSNNHRIQRFSREGAFELSWGTFGNRPGELNRPKGVAVAADGSVYVADQANHRIQHFDADGGYRDGWEVVVTSDGQFELPSALGLAGLEGPHPPTHVSVQHTRIFRIPPGSAGWHSGVGAGPRACPEPSHSQAPSRLPKADAAGKAASLGSSGCGLAQGQGRHGGLPLPRTAANRFELAEHVPTHSPPSSIGSLAQTQPPTLLVADPKRRRVQRFSLEGEFLGAWAALTEGGAAEIAMAGVAADSAGTVYLSAPEQASIYRYDPLGRLLGRWTGDGRGTELQGPAGIAVAPDDSLLVSDRAGRRVLHFAPSGSLLGQWGRAGSRPGQFAAPEGLALAPDGTVIVADTGNGRVQRFDLQGRVLGYWPVEDPETRQALAPIAVEVRPGVPVGAEARVLVAARAFDRVLQFDLGGRPLGQYFSHPQPAAPAWAPVALARGPAGTIFLGDADGRQVHVLGDAPAAQWRVELFANRWLVDRPPLIRSVGAIAFDWAEARPARSLPADSFSLRAERHYNLPAGNYRLWLEAQGGARLWVGPRLLVDDWSGPAISQTLDVPLPAGSHRIRLDYNDPGGPARLRFGGSFEAIATPTASATAGMPATETPTPSATAGAGSSTPSATPSGTPDASATAGASATVTATASGTPTVAVPTATGTPDLPTPTPTGTASASPTAARPIYRLWLPRVWRDPGDWGPQP